MSSHGQNRSRIRAVAIAVVALLLATQSMLAAPQNPGPPTLTTAASTPDWMTQDLVDQLSSVGFTVLAPSYIPGPFGSLPSVSASSGYYSMYWVIPGAPPTYLLVIGGDSIPDYSKYDRNVPLTQNDSVMGYPAWHDQTPGYDLVYFVMDGVVYSVESNNLSGDTTMGIANSLASVDIVAPEPTPTDVPVIDPTPTPGDSGSTPTDNGSDTSTDDSSTDTNSDTTGSPTISAPESVTSGEEVTVSIDGVVSANLSASSGSFSLNGEKTIEGAEPSGFQWTAPETENGRTVRFKLTDPATGELLATTTTTVEPIPDDQIPVVADELACPTSVEMGSYGGIRIKGSGQLQLDASDGIFPAVGPNSTFADPSEVDESDILQGVNRRNKSTWVFWSPADAGEGYTAYVFLQNWNGDTLLECGIEVVPASDRPTYPDGMPSDGTAGSGGIGYASLVSEPDGSNVVSNAYPAVGQNADGSPMSLAPNPTNDGTLVELPATPEATSSPGP